MDGVTAGGGRTEGLIDGEAGGVGEVCECGVEWVCDKLERSWGGIMISVVPVGDTGGGDSDTSSIVTGCDARGNCADLASIIGVGCVRSALVSSSKFKIQGKVNADKYSVTCAMSPK